MDKSTLKKTALESMNLAGSLMEQGDFAAAKDAASRAWNCYFELQKTRNEDEDFTDLIYWARDLYTQCEQQLAAQQPEPEKEEDDEPSPFDIYAEVQKLTLAGFAGNDFKAVQAGMWKVNDLHWGIIDAVGKDIDAEIAQGEKLLKKVMDDTSADASLRAVAATQLAKIFLTPIYNELSVDDGFAYATWAVQEYLAGDVDDESVLYECLSTAAYAAMSKGDIEAGCRFAKLGFDKGLGMSIFYEVCTYGYRHDEKMAPELEKQMFEDGCWEGLLLHGQTMLYDWMDDVENKEKKDATFKFFSEVLAKYADENPDTEAARNFTGLIVYFMFLINWEDTINDAMMDSIEDAVRSNSLWSLYYLGNIYDILADIYSDQDANDSRIPELRKKAEKQFCIAAYHGHRGSFKPYVRMLKERGADQQDIDKIISIARQLDANV